MSAAIFKGLNRVNPSQIPTSPTPSSALIYARDFDSLMVGAFAGIDKYIREACPDALSGSLSFAEAGKKAGAADLVEHLAEIEIKIDRLVLTKAEFETIRDQVGRWEVLVKAIMHAIAVARSQNGELL